MIFITGFKKTTDEDDDYDKKFDYTILDYYGILKDISIIKKIKECFDILRYTDCVYNFSTKYLKKLYPEFNSILIHTIQDLLDYEELYSSFNNYYIHIFNIDDYIDESLTPKNKHSYVSYENYHTLNLYINQYIQKLTLEKFLSMEILKKPKFY